LSYVDINFSLYCNKFIQSINRLFSLRIYIQTSLAQKKKYKYVWKKWFTWK